jgi:predicted RNA-binding Zn-ribbon protein involved in translation (DUF1610 family)
MDRRTSAARVATGRRTGFSPIATQRLRDIQPKRRVLFVADDDRWQPFRPCPKVGGPSMVKSATSRKAGLATPGRKYPSFACQNCKNPLVIVSDVSLLPESFELICPKCGQLATYLKSEMSAAAAPSER